MMKSIAILGGGITGLKAVFRLRQRNVPVTLYEAGARAGGVIETGRQYEETINCLRWLAGNRCGNPAL
jgi:protoporphyrinogen oxidase